MRVSHDYTGAAFDAPDGWELVEPDDRAAARITAIAIEPPGPEDAFRSNLVLTAVPNAGTDLESWQETTDVLLARQLEEYLLLDFERTEVAGRDGVHRVAHYTGPRGEALVVEQWATVIADVGLTLTATIDTLRYDGAADDLEAYGRSLRVDEPGPGLAERPVTEGAT